jgi:hypothetical protein
MQQAWQWIAVRLWYFDWQIRSPIVWHVCAVTNESIKCCRSNTVACWPPQIDSLDLVIAYPTANGVDMYIETLRDILHRKQCVICHVDHLFTQLSVVRYLCGVVPRSRSLTPNTAIIHVSTRKFHF